MWGKCSLAVTSRLGTYYLFYRPMQCREKCFLTTSLGWVSTICFWANAYAGKPVRCYVSHWVSTYSVNSSAGSLLPNFGPCWIMGEMECCLLVWSSTRALNFWRRNRELREKYPIVNFLAPKRLWKFRRDFSELNLVINQFGRFCSMWW